MLKSFTMATLFLAFWLWVVPILVLRATFDPVLNWYFPIGAVLFVAGLVLGSACVLDFARIGEGTPAPLDPPLNLVIAGPYRWVRNPMYLGLALLLLGEALILRSIALAVLVVGLGVAVHAFVVFVEEPSLEKRFGEEYRTYLASVHRWIPRRPQAERAAVPASER